MTKSKINATRLENELNSQAFISGLQAVIDFTIEHEKEAGFEVNYSSASDCFAYKDKIMIGTDKQLSHSSSLNYPAAFDAYKRETGLPLPGKHPEWKARVKTLSKLQMCRELLNGIDWERNYNQLHPKQATHIDYPVTKDFLDRLYKSDAEEEYSGSFPNAIGVHSHPGRKIAIPSPGDLGHLNGERRLNGEIFPEIKSGILSHFPLSVIVAVPKNNLANGIYSVIIINERTREPLPEQSDFDSMAKGFTAMFNREYQLSRFLGRKSKYLEECRNLAIANYNLITAEYSSSSGRIEPCLGEQWGLLCKLGESI